MYGKISGSGWGEQSEFRSHKFYDDTLDSLEKIARENHPILCRIRRHEWDVEGLAADFLANNKSLESMLEKECEENGEDSKRAQELRTKMNRLESANEIKRLRDEYNEASKAYSAVRYPKTEEEEQLYCLNRQKHFSAVHALRSAIKSAVARHEWGWYEDWDKDYDFRDDFEAFLSDIVSARQNFRKDLFRNDETPELVQKYLENPLWHLPQITNFLLVDLIDSDLIMLEGDFYFGLFAPKITNEIESLFSEYIPSAAPMHNVSPNLSPKAKAARRNRRLKTFLIGSGLSYILIGSSLEGERITDLLINEGVPSWIFESWMFAVILLIASSLVLRPILDIVWEYINKRRIRYHSIYNQAHNLLNIRWDICSGTYDAKTCIERLKQLDNQDLHISSLIYPLLELQLKK